VSCICVPLNRCADVQPDTWKAFELTAVQGLSNEAAAQELGKTIGTIYAARSRIMKRLSTVITKMEGNYREDEAL
jgi:RNA polymerase sigma-70 factor (ECF subfamily)